MQVPGFFFNQLATIQVVSRPQDAGGGEVPTPRQVEVLVPCCVQQDSAPGEARGQGRRGSTAEIVVFFRPETPPQADAVEGLKVRDLIVVTSRSGRRRKLILDGPPLDMAGRGAVWQANARDAR